MKIPVKINGETSSSVICLNGRGFDAETQVYTLESPPTNHIFSSTTKIQYKTSKNHYFFLSQFVEKYPQLTLDQDD